MARPSVTLKLATSLDGRIAAAGGASKWITGTAAREQAHRLRAAHGAVLVGAGTARADDPELTVRLPGFAGTQPMRVVLDPNLTLRPTSKLASTAKSSPVLAFALEGVDAYPLRDTGVTVEYVPAADGALFDLPAVLAKLAKHGVSSVMIEGGGHTHASFLRAGLVDRIEWLRAPLLLGGDGVPAIGGLGVTAPDGAPRLRLDRTQKLGDDVWETYLPIRN